MPIYYAPVDSSNKALRASAYRILTGTSSGTNIALGSNFAGTRWWSPSSGSWTASTLGSSNVTMPPGGSYYLPFCYFQSIQTTVQEVGTAYNYGWQLGDTIRGYSNYGGGASDFGNMYGTNSFRSLSGGRTWGIRQIVYNATRNEVAIRASILSGGGSASQGNMTAIGMGPWNSSGLDILPGISGFLRFGSYQVGPDATGVWVYSFGLMSPGNNGLVVVFNS